MSTTSENQTPQQVITPLTPAVIQRATEGLAYARDRIIQSTATEVINSIEAIALGRQQHKLSGKWRRLILRSLTHLLFRVKVEYSERIPTTAAMLAPNHLSHFDPLLILAEVPAHPFYYILGDVRTLYNNWWKRRLLRWSEDTIPLYRRWKEEIAVIEGAASGREDLTDLAKAIKQDVPDGSSLDALRRLERIIQGIFASGDGVIIFPEGGLGNTEGQLRLPLKRGAVIYALRAGVPIVPVAIIGTQDLYFRKKIVIRFGEPLTFPPSNRPKSSEVEMVLDTLQSALMDLLAQQSPQQNWLKLLRDFLNRMLW